MSAAITTPIQAVTVFDVDGQPIITSTTGLPSNGFVWNPSTLVWDRMQQPTITGQTINVNVSGPIAVTGTFFQATQPVSIAGTVAVSGPLTDAQLRAVAVPVSLTSTTITGTVTISGAVTLASTTITGSVAVTGTFWQSTQPVSLASVPSHDVTNAGTFAVQATLAAETTKVIGTVNISAAQTIATVTTITNPVTVTGSVTATLASTTLTATVHPAGLGTVVAGRQTVTTAGTAVQFSAQACKVVAITAETDNTGVIVIGDSAVVAAIATRKGTPLAAGDTAICAVSNMNVLYFDSTVSGDGVTWTVLS